MLQPKLLLFGLWILFALVLPRVGSGVADAARPLPSSQSVRQEIAEEAPAFWSDEQNARNRTELLARYRVKRIEDKFPSARESESEWMSPDRWDCHTVAQKFCCCSNARCRTENESVLGPALALNGKIAQAMTEQEWEDQATQLAGAHHVLTSGGQALVALDLDVVRRCLIDIDRLMRPAPIQIQQRYKAFAEVDLRAMSDEAIANLDEGSLSWLAEDLVRAAGAQVRALDQFLFEHRPVRGKPDDANKDFLCVEEQVHVICRPQAVQPAPNEVTTTTYRRRGLVHHRLLPVTTPEGFHIDLQWHQDLSLSFRRPNATVLAALFDELRLEPTEGLQKFLAREAPCRDEEATLATQAADCFSGDVLLGLWPELTMPPERRKMLAAELRKNGHSQPIGSGPAIIAAGSWHETEGASVRNRMHILSSMGRPRFYHDKSLPMESKSLGNEELEGSYRIPVLIGEDVLIAFAICRDFCEGALAISYGALDVDLMIVCSYGDEKTISAHQARAKALGTEGGARTFLVQQIIPEQVSGLGFGFILPPDTDCSAIAADGLRNNHVSSTHPISFKKV